MNLDNLTKNSQKASKSSTNINHGIKNTSSSQACIVQGNESFYRKRMIKRLKIDLKVGIIAENAKISIYGCAKLNFTLKSSSEIPIWLELAAGELLSYKVNKMDVLEEADWNDNKLELFNLKKGDNFVDIVYKSDLPEWQVENFKSGKIVLLQNFIKRSFFFPCFLQNSMRFNLDLTIYTLEQIGTILSHSKSESTIIENPSQLKEEKTELFEFFPFKKNLSIKKTNFKIWESCLPTSAFLAFCNSSTTFHLLANPFKVQSRRGSQTLLKSRSKTLLERISFYSIREETKNLQIMESVRFLHTFVNETLKHMQKDLDLQLNLKYLRILLVEQSEPVSSFNLTFFVNRDLLLKCNRPDNIINLALEMAKGLAGIFFGQILTNAK